MQCNTFTVVTHPVGYHRDTFGKDKHKQHNSPDSLENKTCFYLPRQTGSFGRGGDQHNFVWALLDWRNTDSGRRRRAYIEAGGDGQVQLTLHQWIQFLQQPGNLQRVVQAVPAMRGSNIIPAEHGLRALSQVVDI
eukprot:scaffold27668_cov167-Amphora_coffeaeformis.AAC.1